MMIRLVSTGGLWLAAAGAAHREALHPMEARRIALGGAAGRPCFAAATAQAN
jgi:hypothetical protein